MRVLNYYWLIISDNCNQYTLLLWIKFFTKESIYIIQIIDWYIFHRCFGFILTKMMVCSIMDDFLVLLPPRKISLSSVILSMQEIDWLIYISSNYIMWLFSSNGETISTKKWRVSYWDPRENAKGSIKSLTFLDIQSHRTEGGRDCNIA
jgi:hypothetical protein